MYRRPVARLLLCLTGAIASLGVPALTQQSGRAIDRVNGYEAMAREALVRFRAPVQPADLADLAALADARDVRPIGRQGLVRVQSRSIGAADLIALLTQRGDLLYVEPNYIVRTFTNDSRFPEMWGLENIGQAVYLSPPGTPGADIQAVPAWNITVGSDSHVVAVIDTGIDYRHRDLVDNMWSAPASFTVALGQGVTVTCAAGTHGFNAITGSCNPMDDNGHGTHVAGTIGAVGNNGLGVVGVNWTTRLMGVKFLDGSGAGSIADAVSAIRFVIETRRLLQGNADVRVLSASWGGSEFSQALSDEIVAAGAEDMLFVAAAGNNGTNNDLLPTYPASFNTSNMMVVAATTNTDGRAWFSNYGASSVHLGAPGVDILSTLPRGSYGFSSGTSMATPHVSGAAALVLSRCTFDTAQLKDALLATVHPVAALASTTTTGGRLDVNSAIHACVAAPAPPTLSATGGNGQITLSWSPMLGATSYAVKRSLTTGGPYEIIDAAFRGTRYTDVNLVNGTTYYYVVSAANSLGTSADSNEAWATPNIPSDLVVSSLSVPFKVGAGSAITVSVTTTNQGNGPAGASITRLYLSDNSILDAGDVAIDPALPVPALSPGGSSSASMPVTIPVETPVGPRFLLAVADAGQQVGESQETNNGRVAVVVVGPDLVVAGVNAPVAAAAGEAITITDTVVNSGGGTAAASTTGVYLSADLTLDAGDMLLSPSRSVPSLNESASSSGSVTVTIPTTVPVGQWWLIAKADAGNVVTESYETNNTSLRSIRIGADLVVSAFSTPVRGGAGLPISVTDTTMNQGTGSTASSTTRFYLSANAQRDAGDTEIGSRAVPPLAAGTGSSATTTLTIPSGTTTGVYFLLAVADADGVVPETLETNNLYARTIQIGGDLSVASLAAPATAAPGASIVVSDTTTNQGSGSIGATTTRYYFSTDAVLGVQDVTLGSRSVPALAAGGSHAGSVPVTLPAGAAAGTYYVIARADADDAVAEASESNNTLARVILLGGDLTIPAFTAPGKAGAGLPVVVTDTTSNSGAASVPATVTRFYLSANSILDASDSLLAGSRAVPQLAPGAVSSGSTTVTLPATAPVGLYYVIAKADADGDTGETNENNNTAARLVQIGPDLVVSGLTGPTAIAAGSTIGVTVTTANPGGGAAAASVTAFALSTNPTLDGGDIVLGGNQAVAALAAGGAASASVSLSIPAGVTPGLYYVLANADAGGAVVETWETNNVRSHTVWVGPDLVVSAGSLSAGSVQAGSDITATETVLNQGAGAAASSTTRFYLSSNALFDANDTLLPGGRNVPALTASASSVGSSTVTIPAATPSGTYFVMAVADGTATVAETNEGNNARIVGSLQVSSP